MEEEKKYKESKFLGATNNQALYISILMAILHSFNWAYQVTSKISFEEYMSLSSSKREELVEWYFYYPTFVLTIWLLDHYISKFSFPFLVKMLIVVGSTATSVTILKTLFTALLYSI
jgi:hypothetical protein